jgi:ubiquinone/menaquinone biosynthesis C-methylase UbiE
MPMSTDTASINTASGRLQRDIAHAGVEPIRYLDQVSATEFAKHYKALTYRAVGARPGAVLLDVGCGPGDDVLAMARLVAPGGSVRGVDLNARMIAEAWKRLGSLKLPAAFQVCDAQHLEFPDGTFDGARCDRVLQHLPDPQSALAQMVRVTRGGGKVVAIEPDWDTFTVDCGARAVARKITDYMAERSVRSGWIGRQLYRLLLQLGLQNVEVLAMPMVLTRLSTAEQIWGLSRHSREAVTAGMISESDRVEWQRQLQAADAAGSFFSSASGYMVCGTKPGSG